MNGSQFTQLFQGIQLIKYHPEIETLFNLGIEHLQATAKDGFWYERSCIAWILNSLQNVPFNPVIQKFLALLGPHLKANTQESNWWTEKEIRLATYGLQNMANTVETDKIMTELTVHMSKIQHLFSSTIAVCLYSLQNMALTSAIKGYITLLANHILLHAEAKNWFSALEIRYCFQGIRSMEGSEVEALLSALKFHLEGKAEAENWLNQQALGDCLGSLQTMGASSVIEGLLITLTRHLEEAAKRGEYLSVESLMLSLRGIQNFYTLKKVVPLLHILQAHIKALFVSKSGFFGFPAHQWLAEAIFSLRFYCSATEPQKAVVRFIGEKAHTVQEDFDIETLNYPTRRLSAIMKLGRYKVQKEQNHWQFYLQHCSLDLAKALVGHQLAQFGEKVDYPVHILFSREMSEVKKEEINHVVDIWLPDNTQIWRGATLIITPPMKMELKGSLELNYANSEEAVDTPMLTT